MKQAIRMLGLAGVLAVCCVLMLAVPACESTDTHAGHDHGSQLAASKCPCGADGDPAISAMVSGKKYNYCCSACKTKHAGE